MLPCPWCFTPQLRLGRLALTLAVTQPARKLQTLLGPSLWWLRQSLCVWNIQSWIYLAHGILPWGFPFSEAFHSIDFMFSQSSCSTGQGPGLLRLEVERAELAFPGPHQRGAQVQNWDLSLWQVWAYKKLPLSRRVLLLPPTLWLWARAPLPPGSEILNLKNSANNDISLG